MSSKYGFHNYKNYIYNDETNVRTFTQSNTEGRFTITFW